MNYAVRLNSFKKQGSSESCVELIKKASITKGLTHMDLNYPEHFAGADLKKIKNVLAITKLKLNSVQMRYKDNPRFSLSALSSPTKEIRDEAVKLAFGAIDSLVYLGSDLLTVWPSQEGFDYAFQINYQESYKFLVDSLKRILKHNPSIRLSIEYKQNDPHAISLIPNAASAILLANDIGADRSGITLDFCHSLMSLESPSAAVSLIEDKSRLFGIHLNDGYGTRDDGLMVGSIHTMQTIELIYMLHKYKFNGVIYFDTFPTYADPVKECEQNIHLTEKMIKIVSKVNFRKNGTNFFNLKKYI